MSEERHQQLMDQLKKNQDAIANLQQENTGIQARIKLLETHEAELKKATDAYPSAAAKASQDELATDTGLIQDKIKIAGFAVKDLKDAIDKAIADFDNNLDKQNTDAQTAADAAKKAATDNDTAVENLRKQQAAYADLQNKPKTIDAGLKDLKALLDQATKAEAQNDPRAAYFHLHEAEAGAKKIDVPSAEKFSADLEKSQTDVEGATQDAADKKAALDKAMADAAAKKKAYDAASASRRSDLLAALRKLVAPPPAEPAPPPAPARRGAAGPAETGPG
jgi:hypothetical protein